MAESTNNPAAPAPRKLAGLLPLALAWALAVAPFAIWLIHQSSPEAAVAIKNGLALWSLRIALIVPLVALLAALAYPPFPAWLRLFLDRTRTGWTVDRAPLTRALSELRHFESAQRHYEVAKLAWLRNDLPLTGTHAARAVELDGTMAQAQYLHGQYLLRAKAPDRAREAFAAAEKHDPGHAFGNALLLQARATHLLGDVDSALELFAQHEREHGGGHRSNYWHGESLAARGRSDEATQRYAAAAEHPKQRLTAEENWFRALARVRMFGRRRPA